MLGRRTAWIFCCLASLLVAGGFMWRLEAQPPSLQEAQPQSTDAPAPHLAVIQQNCIFCHNETMKTGGLAFETAAAHEVGEYPEIWEKVVRKLKARQMPPVGMPRPDEETYKRVVSFLETSLDKAAAAHPNPGRTATFRRLTRTEYENAVRDLLVVQIDGDSLLPPDEPAEGFDNVAVENLSPMLLERYVSAAEKISRLAVGRPISSPDGTTVRIKPDITQEKHVQGLPIGTRGGAAIRHTFPLAGEYLIQVRLARDRNEHIEGLSEPHELEILSDNKRVELFTVTPPPRGEGHQDVDDHLKVRVPVQAGPHTIGVTFVKKPWLLLETLRQPYEAHFNFYRHPRVQPAVYEISIVGPSEAAGPGETPSRDRIFVCRPASASQEDDCAKRILSTLMRRAYRRPVSDADFERIAEFYRQGKAQDGFAAGIQRALSAVLVSPEFLFRIEEDPDGIAPNTPYRISDLELASRLSFFLWSSIPDDELLDAAIRGELSKPEMLEQQVRRMLADPRSRALVTNFASQWLELPKLESIEPNMRLFTGFDDNLRQAFRKETELFVESIIREDRSVLDLLDADYTFVNERLAKHYGIPHVYGSRFRRIALEEDSKRGGLLGHGSILMLTSYATRTSPVIRGKWILSSLLGMPPPPPPPDIPDLKDNTVDGSLSVRARLAEHRKNPTCARCHNLIDPLGLALENYDAIGRWRTVEAEAGEPIDASGGFPDGSEFVGVSGLEEAMLRRPELFVTTLAAKLLTYALGRGVESYDAQAIRKIVREAGAENFRFSSLILGIAESKPFQMRRSGAS
ncbi:MAG: DUF1592 domain-containing protein [Acidobacteriota bacterium]